MEQGNKFGRHYVCDYDGFCGAEFAGVGEFLQVGRKMCVMNLILVTRCITTVSNNVFIYTSYNHVT